MIKGSIQQEDTTFVNIYAPNIGAPKYIKQILTDLKREIDCNTIIVGDVNAPLTSICRSSRWRINQETLALSDISDMMDLKDIYKTFHLKATECTFFSSAHGTFPKIDHMLGHKTSLFFL